MTLEQRVDRLEKLISRLTAIMMAVVVVSVLAVLTGANAPDDNAINAKRIILFNEDGQVVGDINGNGIADGNPCLRFLKAGDDGKKASVVIGAVPTRDGGSCGVVSVHKGDGQGHSRMIGVGRTPQHNQIYNEELGKWY